MIDDEKLLEDIRKYFEKEEIDRNKRIDDLLNNKAKEVTQETIEKAGQDAAKVAGRYKTFGTKVLPGLLGATATLIGLASIVSVGLDNDSKDRAIRENMKADKKLKRQQKKDEKDYGDLGYGFETYQEVMANAQKGKKFKGDPVVDMLKYDGTVQDMYSNRTGHTNMGNSRFR
ncbi:MAG TPA: hypothetical protein VK190_03295 [Pseudoneobacillus sp.]|jgi:hypothetical protein|nr:hypothetical protein [Pseudoneobacillus sp.]